MFRAKSSSLPSRSPIVSGRWLALVLLAVLLVLLAGCDNRYKNQMSIQFMGNQPKYYPLGQTDFFPDQKQSRPLEPGVVPRGPAGLDTAFLTGKQPGAAGATGGQATPGATGGQAGATPAATGGATSAGTPSASRAQAAATPAAAGQTAQAAGGFVEEFPFDITPAVMLRGQSRYNAYCTPCHGAAGYGDGMIVQRGFVAGNGGKPPSFHIDRLRQVPAGYFVNVMTNGFGTMPDYSGQIMPDDRWAIAAYIRALQLSQNAKVSDLTPEQRTALGAGGQ